MKMTAVLITLFTAAFHVLPSAAAEGEYLCTITRGYSLEESGLKRNRRVMASLESVSFEIDRQTGIITGTLLQNSRFDPTVIAPGTSENSFQAYWIVSGVSGTRVRFIEVQEFVDEPRKPFRAIVQNWTYTGWCL